MMLCSLITTVLVSGAYVFLLSGIIAKAYVFLDNGLRVSAQWLARRPVHALA